MIFPSSSSESIRRSATMASLRSSQSVSLLLIVLLVCQAFVVPALARAQVAERKLLETPQVQGGGHGHGGGGYGHGGHGHGDDGHGHGGHGDDGHGHGGHGDDGHHGGGHGGHDGGHP